MFFINIDEKRIYDGIHGYIPISNIALHIIDSPKFQRLRYLHQLGTCMYVFPNAVHSRFEHSIGTYHLCGKILNCIRLRTSPENLHLWLAQIPELQNYYQKINPDPDYKCILDDYVCELVKIAALCHDLGHGPFSHVFDDVFMKTIRKDSPRQPNDRHEVRSGKILEMIIQSNPILSDVITQNTLQFIKNLIDPQPEHTCFIYQIVSNNLNGLDVDKFDYLKRDCCTIRLEYSYDPSRLIDDIRVIDDKICYPSTLYYEIYTLFSTRYRLHKQVYCHKAVISTQYMINDIMLAFDPIIGLANSINDLEAFCNIDDYSLLSVIKSQNNTKEFEAAWDKIDDAKTLLNKIHSRDLYKFVDTFVSDKPLNITWETFNQIDPEIKEDQLIIHSAKIGFISGNKKNPLECVYFYDKKKYSEAMNQKKYSKLIKKI
jgi:HD superfamily phosphohydrolase